MKFDLDRYLRASGKLDLEGIDFARVSEHPLTDKEVRCLTYMMDIETHTIMYLRDLLSTPAAFDPDVTAFLSLWVYEEFWHGEALGRFLKAAGSTWDPNRVTQIRTKAVHGGTLTKIAKTIAAKFSTNFIAVHMAWGAVNELSTLHSYQRLIAETKHPILAELLGRIIKDERRHFAFYFSQARMRLAENRSAQKLVRWALSKFWAPVGTGVRPKAETDFVITSLFGNDAGNEAIEQMQFELGKLPGLSDLRILSAAREKALAH